MLSAFLRAAQSSSESTAEDLCVKGGLNVDLVEKFVTSALVVVVVVVIVAGAGSVVVVVVVDLVVVVTSN